MTLAITIYLIIINLTAFACYGVDKLRAKHNLWRISETTLLMLAIVGGSIGALLGMHLFRHKTQHKKFTIGLPLTLIAQTIATIIVLTKI